jgi:hypothetical protein
VAATECTSPHATFDIGRPRRPLTAVGLGQKGHQVLAYPSISAPAPPSPSISAAEERGSRRGSLSVFVLLYQ